MFQAINEHLPAIGDRFCRDLLGDRYVIWSPDQFLSETSLRRFEFPCELSTATEVAIHQLARHVAGTRQPMLRQVADDQFAWAVPISGQTTRIAVELVANDPARLADIVNRSSLCAWTRELSLQQSLIRLDEQELRLQAYATQASEDLEELTWLRNLASNLELSESGNSVERIAETVLPSLCRLINAHALIFIRDVPVTGLDAGLPIIWQTGHRRFSRHSCIALVESLLDGGDDRTVVQNFEMQPPEREILAGVKSCILVPVTSESRRLGWLLATKHPDETSVSVRNNGMPSSRTRMNENAFGAFEASLITATAVVLAAHARNCGFFHENELMLRGVIRSMINAIDAKDSYTCGHSDRVAEFSRLIAKEMSLDFATCEQIYMTGILHDVGKIGVPDHVLKKPGQLSESEFEQIKQHPVIGYEILKHLENLNYVLPGVLHHHEAMDGSGYPHGLKAEEIPLAARILAVADSYDAMTSNRPYRRGMPTEKAEAILRDGAGRQWDPACVDAFFRTAGGVRLLAQQRSTPFLPSTLSSAAAGSVPRTEMQAVG